MSLPNNVDIRKRFIVATGGVGYGGDSGNSNGTLQGGTAKFQVGILSECSDISMIFNNAFGSQPETLGANPILIRAGILSQKDSVTPIPLYFKGSRTAILEPGASIETDPLPVTIQPPVLIVQTFVQPLGTYEVDAISLGAASAGTVVASFIWGGVTYTTGSIAYNATNVAVQAALLAATGGSGQTLPPNSITVSGGPLPAAIVVTFSNQITGAITSQTITPTGLTGGTATFTRTTNGVYPGTYPGSYGHESQTAGGKALNLGSAPASFTNYANPSGVDLTFSNQTTGLISSPSYSYQPEAIIGSGPSLTPSVLLIGDSILQGFGDTTGNNAARWTAGFAVRAMNEAFPYSRLEAYGDTAANYANQQNIYARAAPLKYGHYAICEYGSNDIYGLSATLAAVQASLIQIWDMVARRGTKVYQTTISCRTTSTDSWATLANQTVVTGNTTRIALNTWIRQGAPVLAGATPGAIVTPTTNGTTNAIYAGQTGHPLTGYFEAANTVETAQDSGFWQTNGTANKYTADGIHPSTAGYILMQACVNTALFI